MCVAGIFLGDHAAPPVPTEDSGMASPVMVDGEDPKSGVKIEKGFVYSLDDPVSL